MFERFLPSARRTVQDAVGHARRLEQPEVGPEHFLLALATGEGGAAQLLQDNDVTAARIESAIALTIVLETEEGPLTQNDAAALRTIGIDLDQVREELARHGPAPLSPRWARRTWGGRPAFSRGAKAALAAAVQEARYHGQPYLAPEHLLLGVLAAKGSLVAELFGYFEVTPEDLRAQLVKRLRRAS